MNTYTNKIEIVINKDSAPAVALELLKLTGGTVSAYLFGEDILFKIIVVRSDLSGVTLAKFLLYVGTAIERGKGIILKLEIS